MLEWLWPHRPGKERFDPQSTDALRALVVPAYDGLTHLLASWLEGSFARQPDVIELCRDLASSASLQSDVIESGARDVLLIFCGHGSRRAFLTAPELGRNDTGIAPEHSRLCGSSEFRGVRSVSIFGYCCSSAAGFGREVREMSRLNAFLGFTGKPMVVVGNERREAAFRQPLQNMVRRVTAQGRIGSEDANALVAEYTEAYQEWIAQTNEGGGDDRRMIPGEDLDLLVALGLLLHIDSVDLTV